jgi:hypothetical protein
MTGKTAVERIGSAVVATYVQIESKEPKVGLRGKLTPEMIPDLAEFPGKAEDSASGSGVGFQSWKSAMKREGVESLPLYPEGRACRRPTARRVIDLFEDVQRHELTEGGRSAVVFTTELTRLQRKILRLLGMPRAYRG